MVISKKYEKINQILKMEQALHFFLLLSLSAIRRVDGILLTFLSSMIITTEINKRKKGNEMM